MESFLLEFWDKAAERLRSISVETSTALSGMRRIVGGPRRAEGNLDGSALLRVDETGRVKAVTVYDE